MTPDDKGICYHCNSPLPTEIDLPPGYIVCPNCLRVTPATTGYCTHCRAKLPIAMTPEKSSESSASSNTSSGSLDPQVGPVGGFVEVGASWAKTMS